MQKFLVSIVLCLLVKSMAVACGFYPYGEDIRFNLLKPESVFPGVHNKFYYTSDEYYGIHEFEGVTQNHYDENLTLWAELMDHKVDKKSIFDAVYSSSVQDIKDRSSKNKFIQLLQLKENKAIRNYLIFAIECSNFNSPYDDPWERNVNDSQKKRSKMIKKALKLASKEKNTQLIKRYAHLAIRMAHYNGDDVQVEEIYNRFFSSTNEFDALDLWALHFRVQHMESSPERNVLVARVFAYSHEKRFAVHQFYDNSLDFDFVYSEAKSTSDKAALAYLQASIQMDHSMKYIQLFAKNSTNDALLTELALREINKLEDWIYTPYYSNFSPSTPLNWDYEDDREELTQRIKLDRNYAHQLSQWMQSKKVDMSWWTTLQSYAQWMAQDYSGLSKQLDAARRIKSKNDEETWLLDQLYSLTKIASKEDAALNDIDVQQILLKADEKGQNVFIFAMARELEYAGNTTDAACLLAHVNKSGDWNETAYWKTKERHHSLHSDIYYEYFTYMDVAYSIDEVNQLIAHLTTNARKTSFRAWLDSEISKETTRLHDLVGTKYFRKNQLQKALEAFKKVDDTLWTSDFYYYKDYLNEDPFTNNFYSPGVQPEHDGERSYTKPELVERMLELIARYESSTGNKKAMAAYLLANAYRNMSQYGNAWMMRRYFWSSNAYETGLEDDDEYYQCNLAKKYYLLAHKASKSSKFAVLALRMAGKCESYKLLREVDSYYLSPEEYGELFHANAFYKEIKHNYPEDYERVVSNCDALQGYFEEGLN